MRRRLIRFGFTLAVLLFSAALLQVKDTRASESWSEIRDLVFEGRDILPGGEIINLKAPMRPEDQSAVPISMKAHVGDGRTIKRITFIVDENPTPVAAVFTFGENRTDVSLSSKFRLNSATSVRAIVEASDGALYMAERFVKFAGGQAACSAPPMGDPHVIAANMGNMSLELAAKIQSASQLRPDAKIKVSHPNHTGMVLDQITLLHIPLKIVSEMEVSQGDDLVFKMEGSMTLSQDPEVAFNYKANGASQLKATVTDTDGDTWQGTFPIGPGS